MQRLEGAVMICTAFSARYIAVCSFAEGMWLCVNCPVEMTLTQSSVVARSLTDCAVIAVKKACSVVSSEFTPARSESTIMTVEPRRVIRILLYIGWLRDVSVVAVNSTVAEPSPASEGTGTGVRSRTVSPSAPPAWSGARVYARHTWMRALTSSTAFCAAA